MKWPSYLVIIRHGQSAYNALREKKERDPLYREFKSAHRINHRSERCRQLAEIIREKYALGTSDYGTPLSQIGWDQSRALGRNILQHVPPPDVVYISPLLRTEYTFTGMQQGGFHPGDALVVRGEDRIREQEHGLSLLYSDWRVFQTYHPEQKELRDLLGPYWYQYPQGESVSQVRDRIRLFTNMLIREHSGKVVYLVSHHLTKLSIRANLERLTPEEFIRLDEDEKPINCGVTIYRGEPKLGSDGKLLLQDYNLRLY